MSGMVQEIASTIKSIITSQGHIPGSRLAGEIKTKFPDWHPSAFGVTSLREFINTNVPDVIEAGRSGMDVIYSLKSAAPTNPVALALPVPSGDFWRVWVSPNSPHALMIDRDGGAIQAVPRRASVPATQLLVEPLSATEHRNIAKEFLTDLPSDLQEHLRTIVESTSETWWQAWLKALRGPEQVANWNSFRRQQLEASLRARLRNGGLDAEVVERVIRQIHESQAASVPRSPRAKIGNVPVADSTDAVRQLVVLAINRMNISELRELRLPLGIVLDALATSKSR